MIFTLSISEDVRDFIQNSAGARNLTTSAFAEQIFRHYWQACKVARLTS